MVMLIVLSGIIAALYSFHSSRKSSQRRSSQPRIITEYESVSDERVKERSEKKPVRGEAVAVEPKFSPKYISEQELKKIMTPRDPKPPPTPMQIYEEKLRIRHEKRLKKLEELRKRKKPRSYYSHLLHDWNAILIPKDKEVFHNLETWYQFYEFHGGRDMWDTRRLLDCAQQMARIQSDARIPNQGCTGYITGHPIPTGTHHFYQFIPRLELQKAARAFSKHYKVDRPRGIDLEPMELGPSPEDMRWLMGIRFTMGKCNGFNYLRAPDTLPNDHTIESVYDERSFDHLQLAFLYYICAATGSWGYFLGMEGVKMAGSSRSGADPYTMALTYYDYLGRIGHHGNRCEAWEKLKVPHIINERLCMDYPLGTRQQPIEDHRIFEGPNPLVPGNPLEYWDPRGNEPRPRERLYAFPRPGQKGV